jgi:hypothetical protein
MAILSRVHTDTAGGVRVLLVIVSLLAALPIGSRPAAAQTRAQLDELKAAFVFQFANFITWPESAFADSSAPIVIGIMGNEDMAELLRQSVLDRKVSSRSIIVRSLSAPAESAQCHIVFLDKEDDRLVDEYLAALKDQPVLTVSDDNNFTEEGGIIKLYEQQNKLRIEINADALERSKLVASSKLMSLARVVRDDT